MSVIAGKIEMVKSKWGLAFSAVISVIASLVMAAGLCSFFGLVTTLDSRSDITDSKKKKKLYTTDSNLVWGIYMK